MNVLDILKYLAANWKWFVLSIAICLCAAYYKYIITPRTYYSNISVLVQEAGNGSKLIGLDKFSNSINGVNVSNEMHMLLSKELIRKMVYNTRANVCFTIRVQLFQGDMYGNEPVLIEFLDSAKYDAVHFTMKIKDASQAVLSDFHEGSKTLIVPIGKVVSTPAGRIRMTLTEHFNSTWIDLETHVTRYPIESIVRYYHNAISIRQNDEQASIINLALQDNSYRRAQAVLRGLIDVYNEDALQTKQLVSVNTAKFIDERLAVIDKELSGTDEEIAQFKVANKMIRVQNTGLTGS